MRVIGAIGFNGSGKDEVLKYLRDKYHVPFFSTGDMVRAIARKEGREMTRENLQNISTKYFAEFGKGYFVKLLAAELQKQELAVVGISGIRSADDVRILRDTFGNKFILIHVYIIDPQVRFRRLSQRGEERDPHTYEQFLQQEANEENIFQLKQAVSNADYTLDNSGALDELHQGIDRLVAAEHLLETGS